LSLAEGERIQVENFSTSQSSLDAEVLGGVVYPPELAFEPTEAIDRRLGDGARCKSVPDYTAWSAGTCTRSSTRRRRPRATVD
jgi:hypothetical protein